MLVWVLAGSSWGFLFHHQVVRHAAVKHLRLALATAPSPVEQEAALLKEVTPPGGAALVVAERDALYHLVAGVPSASHACQCQLLLVEEFEQLCHRLEEEPERKERLS